jgi:hypothetical protein
MRNKMMGKINLIKLAAVVVLVVGIMWALVPRTGYSHCDTLDGPVVSTARSALDKADVTAVLKWVRKIDEGEIKKAFENTLAVRKLSPQAKNLADMYFFETLVRVHRAAEGAGYTGLKPAGSVEPPVAAADKALESKSVDFFMKEISNVVSAGILERFNHTVEAKKHADESVEAGRLYVKAYVEFVHYVEALHKTATGQTLGHEGVEKVELEGHHTQ